ncbi:MAG: SDR family NAD(P)-dependent oxidoreductase, partial [Flavobacterium sp.]
MKTIFITGASSGIGKATAIFFQAQGWKVIA